MKYTEEELSYIQWLKDIKPKWTEKQVLESAGKKFNKNFLPKSRKKKGK